VAVIVDFIKDHVVEISNIVTGAVTKAASASAPFLSGIDPWAFAPVCKVLDEQIGQRIENMGMTDEVRERLTQLLEAELAAAVEKRV
jgi:hypothetical protein